MQKSMCDVSELVGKVLKNIELSHDSIKFIVSDLEYYTMFHDQNCCETVVIEDICGDLAWLVGSPILRAEERVNKSINDTQYVDDSFTWTFYELASIKGSITIRWYGESNGYYSESVNFERVLVEK